MRFLHALLPETLQSAFTCIAVPQGTCMSSVRNWSGAAEGSATEPPSPHCGFGEWSARMRWPRALACCLPATPMQPGIEAGQAATSRMHVDTPRRPQGRPAAVTCDNDWHWILSGGRPAPQGAGACAAVELLYCTGHVVSYPHAHAQAGAPGSWTCVLTSNRAALPAGTGGSLPPARHRTR